MKDMQEESFLGKKSEINRVKKSQVLCTTIGCPNQRLEPWLRMLERISFKL